MLIGRGMGMRRSVAHGELFQNTEGSSIALVNICETAVLEAGLPTRKV